MGERPHSQKKLNFTGPTSIQNDKACSGFPESPIQGALRRHPVIHMNREQCFLSEVKQFSKKQCLLTLRYVFTQDYN